MAKNCNDCGVEKTKKNTYVNSRGNYEPRCIKCKLARAERSGYGRHPMSEKKWSVKWEQNGAVMSLLLHEHAPTDEPSDLLEFTVQPAEGMGERHSWYMNKDDAVAMIYLMSRALLEMQMEADGE